MKRGKGLKVVRYEIEDEVVERMEGFVKPFCWLYKNETDMLVDKETVLARFGALTRYYLLAKGQNKAIKGNMTSFEGHFRGTCRDVAAAQEAKWVEPETPSLCESSAASVLGEEQIEGEEEVTEETSSSFPSGFRYDFEVFVDTICGTSPTLPANTSNNYKSTSTTQAPYPLSSKDVQFEINSAAAACHIEDHHAEITSLRNKIQLLDLKLLEAEGRARKAENEAANWQLRYEQEVAANRAAGATGAAEIYENGARRMEMGGTFLRA